LIRSGWPRKQRPGRGGGETKRQKDVKNCILLTNEHISESALAAEDGQYYRGLAGNDERSRAEEAAEARTGASINRLTELF